MVEYKQWISALSGLYIQINAPILTHSNTWSKDISKTLGRCGGDVPLTACRSSLSFYTIQDITDMESHKISYFKPTIPTKTDEECIVRVSGYN